MILNTVTRKLIGAVAILCAAAAIQLLPVQSAPAGALSPKDRASVFEDVWKNVRDRYYDPEFHGVDWTAVGDKYRPLVAATKTDEDFYALLNRMTGELHDAHTRFNTPSQWENRKKEQAFTIGFLMTERDGKMVVNSVIADSSAARAGVTTGLIVLTVNDQPVADLIAAAAKTTSASSTDRITQMRIYSNLFRGGADATFQIGFQKPDGSNFAVTLTKQTLPQPVDVRPKLLPSGNLYIRFDGFQEQVEKELKETLEKYRDAPGVIIDLRQNPGGRADVLADVAAEFLNEKTVIAQFQTRKDISSQETTGEAKALRKMQTGAAGRQLYAGPVVILTDEYTGSSAEIFSGGLQEIGRAKVVGTQTCGCVIGIANNQKMKGGGVLEISEVLFFTPKGRKLEGEGVVPDSVVRPTLADLQQQRDVVLERAEEILKSGGSQPASKSSR
jgi:carboxyl-terminal processing protease